MPVRYKYAVRRDMHVEMTEEEYSYVHWTMM
jgi:hypothetical protein